MPFARLSETLSTLRFRLSVWNTTVVLAMVLAALMALREGLRYTLIREADQLLLENIEELGLAVAEFYPDLDLIHEEMNRKAKGHEQRHLFVQVFDPQGNHVWSSIHTPEEVQERRAYTADMRPRTLNGYRLVQRQLAFANVPAYTIRVGSSLAYVEEDVERLTHGMLVIGAVLLVAAPLGGYWLAGRATRPLGQIIHTAANLRPSKLDERLPIRHTGDELDQLSATINGLLDRIAAYVERNRQFTANAAHELRSPLAAIRSAVEVALNAPRTTQQYQDLLEEMVEVIGDLSLLVNQLLLLAESDSPDRCWREEPVAFDRIVLRAVDMFQGVAEERGIQLSARATLPVIISGDASRLREVVNNLLDNALKFTPSGGRISVELDFDTRAQQAKLIVQDTGVGISEQDLPHIFERFYCGDRGRPREGHMRGNGLGLSICLAIVGAHGGSIAVESAPGKGARFLVNLPGRMEKVADTSSLRAAV